MTDIPKDDEELFLMDEEVLDLEEDLEESEDEDEDEEGRSGKSGGGKDPYKVKPKELKKLIDEAELEMDDAWAEKMRLLALGPFSSIIPGASAFDAESDLKKKLLIGAVGVLTHQIQPSDVADPALIQNLQARLQMRQEDMRQLASNMLQQAGLVSGITNAALSIGSELQKEPRDVKFLSENALTKGDQKEDYGARDRDLEAKRGQVAKVSEEQVDEKKKNEFQTSISTIIEKDNDAIDDKLLDLLDNKRDDKYSVASQMDVQDTHARAQQNAQAQAQIQAQQQQQNQSQQSTSSRNVAETGLRSQFNERASQTEAQSQAVQLQREVKFQMPEPSAVLRPQMDQFRM